MHFKRDLSVGGGKENTIMRNRAENGVKKLVGHMPGEKRGGRVERCPQRLPQLDTVQGLIMADIPAHNHKFLSIMWGKSLHCQSRCPRAEIARNTSQGNVSVGARPANQYLVMGKQARETGRTSTLLSPKATLNNTPEVKGFCTLLLLTQSHTFKR